MNTDFFYNYGFNVIDKAFDEQTIDCLTTELARLNFGKSAKTRKSVAFGVRNLLNVAPFVQEFANSDEVRKLLKPIVGEQARVVRAIFFDKTPEANWKVPFHQDLTITVKSRKNIEGFTAWTQKAGIFHVQPPISVLENIVSLRVHLDDTDESNGALRVVGGSHRYGRLSAEDIRRSKNKDEIAVCRVQRCGAMLMRPLLLHASSSAVNALHRRVLHFEFSSANLPEGLEWYGS